MSNNAINPDDVNPADNEDKSTASPRTGITSGRGLIFVFAGVLGVVILVVIGFSALIDTTKDQGVSKVPQPANINTTTAVTGIDASPEYNELVQERNELGVKLATEKGRSFVPTFTGGQLCDDTEATRKLEEERRKAEDARLQMLEAQRQLEALRQQMAQNQAEGNKDSFILPYFKDERGQEYMTPQLKTQREAVVIDQLTKIKAGILSPATQSGAFAIQIADIKKSSDTITPGVPKEQPIVSGGQMGNIIYATLETAINSDIKAPVLAIIRGGPLNGARLIGGYTSSEEYVVLEFTKGTLANGRPITLQGFAIDPSTTLGGLADDVNHHYLLKFGAIGAAAFLQGYGRAMGQSTQRVEFVTVPGSGVSTPVQTNSMSDRQIALSALSEVGNSVSGEIRKMANRPTTVSVNAGSDVGILIIDDIRYK